ncbi:MAG: hypothetical protein D6763_08295 [Alphaproteobacteria bacterium]|nr:MAG: hypothetical protein D6763_08295 [Alphaproteobacteria bacterium]
MTQQHFHYDEMVQKALLGVVREVLEDTARHGLSGSHHFYIAFRTDHPGVSIPNDLRERYKEEMTIVLQNQFWDLKVEADHFEVGLSFNRKPAVLRVPFDAVTGFLDPSVEFGLQFQRQEAEPAHDDGEPAGNPSAGTDKTPGSGDTPVDAEDSGEPNVVTLDAFRKKK